VLRVYTRHYPPCSSTRHLGGFCTPFQKPFERRLFKCLIRPERKRPGRCSKTKCGFEERYDVEEGRRCKGGEIVNISA